MQEDRVTTGSTGSTGKSEASPCSPWLIPLMSLRFRAFALNAARVWWYSAGHAFPLNQVFIDS